MQLQIPKSFFSSVNRAVLSSALVVGLVVGGSLATQPVHAQGGLPDFTELVEKVGPAVVNIRTTERARAGRGGAGGPEMDEDLLEFFRRFGVPIPQQPQPRRGQPQPDAEPQQRGVGSGFILNADGYVMTNAHVVDGADEVIVTLTDRREFKAKIIGADKRTDVALVKIEATGLPTVRVGDVSRLKVGEWVIAIGSPFGLENTVTAGIVSAKARDTGDFLPFIQTDVAINPGNSGGPLINMRGEVVGINSQIYSRSGGFMGISFAIPIDEASRVSEQLRTSGRVIRGRIGVQIDQVTKEVAESIGLGRAMGAFVRSVEGGGPAEKAGVEAGDTITKFDGRSIEKAGDLPRIVGGTKPGSKSTMQVFRRGAYRDLSITVAELESEQAKKSSDRGTEGKSPAAIGALGVGVVDLTDVQRRELKVKGGVRVESVEGAAARANVREGDVILAVDNVEITSAKQFEGVVAKIDKTKAVNVLLRRGEWVTYVVIRPVR
ncbi:MAG: DegQ family serine endoprotease [Burkholderiales bacterium]|nr:DegQ family serine endoprotease [Burkholderiales bacterium]